MLVAMTVAPGTGDFDGSETVPVTSADELRACAKAGKAPRPSAMSRQKPITICFNNMWPPKMAVPGAGDQKMVEFFRICDDLLVALHIKTAVIDFLIRGGANLYIYLYLSYSQ
jgi:hypothetical protein